MATEVVYRWAGAVERANLIFPRIWAGAIMQKPPENAGKAYGTGKAIGT